MHISLIGVPMYLGAGRRGVDMGPSAIRYASIREKLTDLGHTVEELGRYFERIASPFLQWGFSANHAHLLPGDFDAFLDAFGTDRIGLVLVADNRGQVEEHLLPGQGTLDFGRLFGRLEGAGYQGPYMLTFGTRDQKLAGRETLLAAATQAGVSPESSGSAAAPPRRTA